LSGLRNLVVEVEEEYLYGAIEVTMRVVMPKIHYTRFPVTSP